MLKQSTLRRVLSVLLTAGLLCSVPGSAHLAVNLGKRLAPRSHAIRRGPPELIKKAGSRLQVHPVDAPRTLLSAMSPLPAPTLEARLLVISADGKEVALSGIRQALEYLGTPYTLYIAAQNPGQLTPDMLASGSIGRYQGVILTTGNLAYFDGSVWRSALTQEEWANLANYQVAFGVRQVTWYTYPTALYGFRTEPVALDTRTEPLPTSLTPAGAAVFSYLEASNPVTIRGAYTYLSRADEVGAVPLLKSSVGDALAVIRQYPDGRENLALTFDGSRHLTHTVVLSYGIVNWVTRGLFLGYRRVFLSAQVDDVFLPDELYGGGSYRMTGADLERTATWQDALQKTPLMGAIKLDMAFNGEGAEPGYLPGDTLVSATMRLQGKFKWISHTWSHEDLDEASYTTTTYELVRNHHVADMLKLDSYTQATLITPEVSGLYNPSAMRAMRDTGVQYIVSDTSRPGEDNPAPNAGIYNALQPSILEIPRRPTNLFYNVSTPAEWTAEYNALYRSYWGRDLTYEEILEKESDVIVMYMLKGENDPLMFHQSNLRVYDGSRTLLTDLLDLVLAKYRSFYKLPVQSPTMKDLGVEVHNFTRYLASGVAARITGSSVILTSPQDVVVPVTGLATPDSKPYGGQPTAFIPVSAGQSVTIPRPQQ